MTDIYRMGARVAAIEEKKRLISVVPTEEPDGSKGMASESVNDGWFIRLEGLNVSIAVGPDKPKMKVGDRLRITIELDQ